MRLGRSTNPAMNNKIFENVAVADRGEQMTVQGTVNKTILLFLLVLLTSTITWRMFTAGNALYATLLWVGVIGGLISALVTFFKKDWAMYTAPIYALFEGLFLGGISAVFNAKYPGIAFQAIGLTFGVLAVLLLVYKAGIIRATEKFKRGIIAATGGIAVFYIINWILSFFGMSVNFASMGLLGIGIQLVIVVVAALNLVMDFDFIEQGSAAGAPKYFEWFGAFGLMVTLVWLYLEILRLLSLLTGRD